MPKNATVIFRIEEETKNQFQRIVSLEGREVSDVILASIKSVIRNGSIPEDLYPFLKHRSGTSLGIPYIRKALVRIIESRYYEKINKAYLFGSFARGEETKESDVDIHIEPGEHCSIKDIALFRKDLEVALRRQVDVVSGSNLDPEFESSIKKDEICLYDREKQKTN
jgi:predicted nucleotidyltransferase